MNGRWITAAVKNDLDREGTSAHGVAGGRDWWIERFGDACVVSAKSMQVAGELLPRLDEWCLEIGYSPARIYCRLLVLQPGEKDKPVLIRGEPLNPATTVVLENSLQYEVDFTMGYSVGLFPDQRANRSYLRARQPKRVLNAFSYTCAFSVAAASSGAETMSVDLSKSSLNRGRRNFELNGLSLDGHRFLADDVMAVLPRLARRGEKFDAIILDPPTFSRGEGGRTFRAEKDFPNCFPLPFRAPNRMRRFSFQPIVRTST